MHVNLHIGMHFSRTSRLVKSVRLNAANFARHGIVAPPVMAYRPVIAETLAHLDGMPPTRDESRALVREIMGDADARRAVLIDEEWAGPIETAFDDEMLYAGMGENVRRVRELLQTEEVSLSLALINPATYVAGVLGVNRAAGKARWFVRNIPPETISWQLSIDRLLATVPDVPVTIWAEEDAPLIWSRALRHISGLPEGTAVRAHLMALQEILAPEGMKRLMTFLQKFPLTDPVATERAILAFLDKYDAAPVYGPQGGIEGWDDAALATITARYEADIARLAEYPRVTVIQPYVATQG